MIAPSAGIDPTSPSFLGLAGRRGHARLVRHRRRRRRRHLRGAGGALDPEPAGGAGRPADLGRAAHRHGPHRRQRQRLGHRRARSPAGCSARPTWPCSRPTTSWRRRSRRPARHGRRRRGVAAGARLAALGPASGGASAPPRGARQAALRGAWPLTRRSNRAAAQRSALSRRIAAAGPDSIARMVVMTRVHLATTVAVTLGDRRRRLALRTAGRRRRRARATSRCRARGCSISTAADRAPRWCCSTPAPAARASGSTNGRRSAPPATA